MAHNLKSRLQQIKKIKKDVSSLQIEDISQDIGELTKKKNEPPQNLFVNPFEKLKKNDIGFFANSEWKVFGYQVLKRTVNVSLPFAVPKVFPNALAVIVHDLFRYGSIPKPQDLVFFDLETTGLSGGAGTLAFLASFGRFTTGKPGSGKNALMRELEVNQYLLLDYPGEGDFVEVLKTELSKPGSSGAPCLVVSYNGKTFDSQIFKNRCLMNAVVPPEYFHADLLHPSRRLWKHILSDCSQSTIETQILGLDRTGDTPGALAPDIWFSFLKNGKPHELIGICDHNIKDIMGLASICLLLGEIADAPLKILEEYDYDFEALALLWRETVFRYSNNLIDKKTTALVETLMSAAAERLMPKALYVHGLGLLKTNNPEQGRAFLETLVSLKRASSQSQVSKGTQVLSNLKAKAFRSLAIDAEWRLKNIESALKYTRCALSLPEIADKLKDELEYRRERLIKKGENCSTR